MFLGSGLPSAIDEGDHAMDTWDAVRTERTELAELLGGLTPQQWDTQTLCSEWRVRVGMSTAGCSAFPTRSTKR